MFGHLPFSTQPFSTSISEVGGLTFVYSDNDVLIEIIAARSNEFVKTNDWIIGAHSADWILNGNATYWIIDAHHTDWIVP